MPKKFYLFFLFLCSFKALAYTNASSVYVEYPWLLKVFHDQSVATGFLISQDQALIPGHMICRKMVCEEITFIQAEHHEFSSLKHHEAKGYTVHPFLQYRDEWGHDLAVIEFRENIPLSKDSLPELDLNTYTPKELTSLRVYSICGRSVNKLTLVELHWTLKKTISKTFDDDSLSYKLKNNNLCRPGDSGAPLFHYHHGKPLILGALSGEEADETKALSFYPVSRNIDFIVFCTNRTNTGLVTNFPECNWQLFDVDETQNTSATEPDTNEQLFNNLWLFGTLKIMSNLLLIGCAAKGSVILLNQN